MIMQIRVFASTAFGVAALTLFLGAWYLLLIERDWWGAAGLWGYALGATTACILIVGIPREEDL